MLRSLKIITHIYSMSAGEKTSRNWSPILVPRGLVAFRNENTTNCFPHWLPLILHCMFLVKTLFDVPCSWPYREEVISLTKGNGAHHKMPMECNGNRMINVRWWSALKSHCALPLSVSSLSVTYRNRMVYRTRLWLRDFASALSWATHFWYD